MVASGSSLSPPLKKIRLTLNSPYCGFPSSRLNPKFFSFPKLGQRGKLEEVAEEDEYGSTRIEVNADGTLTYPETKIDPNKSEKRSKPLSIEDEQLMRVFYEQKIQEVCRAFGFPNKIQGLGFDLIVYAPYRSIEGFIDDIEDLQETAKKEVDRIMLTDAPLLFPPGQLALAALRRSNEVHRVLDFERYLGSIISRQQSMHTSSELIESLDLINSLLMRFSIPSSDDMKPIDRKLKYCLDPSLQDE
ncbi:hypothetical protein IFM89_014075 [Coptis chinensis]|uniref:Cyclin C-terminal domain-containing protein n=1 Tax=Coptis chinensis TaxID=261450 RepID=A0A835HMV5_9MAGN|nr:hypothetical protein IFM89_014075 [Coptis chinensis]